MRDMGVTLDPEAPDYLAAFDPLSPEFDWGAMFQSRALEQEGIDAGRGIDAALERKRARWLRSPPSWTLDWELTLDPQAGGYDPRTDPCSLSFEPDRLAHRSVRAESVRAARVRASWAARAELDASEARARDQAAWDASEAQRAYWDDLFEGDEPLLTSPAVGESIGARVHARHAAANEV